jgi:hypothetical protein
MQHLEVSGAVRHIYIYVIRRLKVNIISDIVNLLLYLQNSDVLVISRFQWLMGKSCKHFIPLCIQNLLKFQSGGGGPIAWQPPPHPLGCTHDNSIPLICVQCEWHCLQYTEQSTQCWSKWCQDVTGIIGNMVLVNSVFDMWKDFSKKYPQFGYMPSKMFASLVLCWKSLKNIYLKGRQIISLPGGAHISGRPLETLAWVSVSKLMTVEKPN